MVYLMNATSGASKLLAIHLINIGRIIGVKSLSPILFVTFFSHLNYTIFSAKLA